MAIPLKKLYQHGIIAVVKLQEEIIVIRSARKTISLSVNENGTIVVKAPKFVRDAEISLVITRHRRWIARRMRESEQFRLDLSEGMVLTLYGKRYEIATASRSTIKGDTIYLPQPKAERSAALIALLKQLARKTMTGLTFAIAQKYGFTFGTVRISSARGRWGSCSQKCTISYSFRTAFLSQHEAEYIAVHELCHTLHMNHGAAFWAEVEKILPDYRQIRKGIREKCVVMQWL